MPETIKIAMQLYVEIYKELLKGNVSERDTKTFFVCTNLIRVWSVAPATTPIIDIIRLQGITL